MTTAKTNRASEQFTLRFPDGMRDKIKRMAEENRRTANAEIIFLIEQGIEAARTPVLSGNGAA